MHNYWQKDYKCANCQGNDGAGSRDCEVWKKEKDYQTKTYSKNITYPEARRMVDYKICRSNKKISQQQKTKLLYMWNKCNQLVNEMRELIQEMKSHKSSYWKTLQRSIHQSCHKPRKTGKAQGPLTSEVTSVAGPLQTPPKRKTKEGIPPSLLMGRGMV